MRNFSDRTNGSIQYLWGIYCIYCIPSKVLYVHGFLILMSSVFDLFKEKGVLGKMVKRRILMKTNFFKKTDDNGLGVDGFGENRFGKDRFGGGNGFSKRGFDENGSKWNGFDEKLLFLNSAIILNASKSQHSSQTIGGSPFPILQKTC